ncbi:MAG: EAL domain-containing protein, partial [Gammaproteobacteria bacterium]|nr:EAL domain-containing protein [Gammaproteobacteria bacterium]
KLHYIAIFTQIGASTVTSALLISDKRLFIPIITILMGPLIIYFYNIGEWYGYILSIFATIFMWVLYYAANSSFNLLQHTNHQANHDLLTGLYNRHFFIDYLQQRINSLKEGNHYSYLLLIDLDHFKTVNDSLGHDVGDQLLREISLRLTQHIPQDSIVARLGGDEFIVIGPKFNNQARCQDAALALSEHLLATLKQSYIINLHHLYISCSIGISLMDSRSTNANQFIKEADIAMYEVKATGRDAVFQFNEEMSLRVESHLMIERLLHFALKKMEIELHFQPQFDQDKKIIGAETLVRWNNSKLGQVSPADFIPIAEQTGLIIELGEYILESAFATFRNWCERGIELEQFSINISMRQFMHSNFTDDIKRLVNSYLKTDQVNKVIFEVTETIVAEDINKVVAIMHELHELGIRFSMDDFGTGYSSLSYLKQLPIDEIKIDRAFVSELHQGQDENEQAMIMTILNMAKTFRLTTVAEGVETEEQFQILSNQQCKIFQGFLFDKALPKAAFEALYFDNRK